MTNRTAPQHSKRTRRQIFCRSVRRSWAVLGSAVRSFIADDALSRGAAIAYYSVFAIAPILLIAIATAGLVFGEEAAQDAIVQQFSGLMGYEAAGLLQRMIASASNPRGGILGTIFGLGTLLLTATGVFSEIQSALNAIWRARPQRSVVSIFLRARLISLGLVLALGFLMIASLIASAALAAVSGYLRLMFPALPTLLGVLDTGSSLVLIALLTGAIYKFLPDTPIEWEDVSIGAGMSAVLLTAGKWLIGLYIGTSRTASSFGAASALVVILIWVYYCAQIFLLGAEITYAYSCQEHRVRARRGAMG